MAARLDINLGKNTRGKIATGQRDATLGKYVTLHLYDPFNLSSLFPSSPLPVGCIPLHLHLHTVVPYRALFLLQSYVLFETARTAVIYRDFLANRWITANDIIAFYEIFLCAFLPSTALVKLSVEIENEKSELFMLSMLIERILLPVLKEYQVLLFRKKHEFYILSKICICKFFLCSILFRSFLFKNTIYNFSMIHCLEEFL